MGLQGLKPSPPPPTPPPPPRRTHTGQWFRLTQPYHIYLTAGLHLSDGRHALPNAPGLPSLSRFNSCFWCSCPCSALNCYTISVLTLLTAQHHTSRFHCPSPLIPSPKNPHPHPHPYHRLEDLTFLDNQDHDFVDATGKTMPPTLATQRIFGPAVTCGRFARIFVSMLLKPVTSPALHMAAHQQLGGRRHELIVHCNECALVQCCTCASFAGSKPEA